MRRRHQSPPPCQPPRHPNTLSSPVAYPQVIILAGPNGAGKTTAAKGLLDDYLKLGEFVNADTIAAGLAVFAVGRIMLARLHELAAQRANFAFETTMASSTFAP